ncbi:MAG: DUF2065 domain-containing protein [Alphaproteobacteria bacterium]|uniref:DUF2065 domain-containing protein n=1 Tax=Maricaulis alexandrii TaxID=2570354 RepID=UPI001F3D9D16|nr:DUF2065 domain-containing protein [Maricaulis alexandrii]MCR9267065.1 DUF2065 domain-containing protein [Alphaproteobacteria bacterium]
MASYLLVGLGVAMVLEGLLYALMPGGMKRFLSQINEMSPDQLRLAGLVAVGAGVGLVWWVLN